jgi:hypothetical protein
MVCKVQTQIMLAPGAIITFIFFKHYYMLYTVYAYLVCGYVQCCIFYMLLFETAVTEGTKRVGAGNIQTI